MAKKHFFQQRIYLEDTDANGIVYHANFIKYCERARHHLLKEKIDNIQQFMQENKFYFVVKNFNIDYMAPALFDELLTIETEVTKIQPASINFTHLLTCDNTVKCKATVKIASVGPSGAVVRMPKLMTIVD